MFIDGMIIDSKRRITPFKQNNGKCLSFPDHYSIVLSFRGIPTKEKHVSIGKKYTHWNTNRENGWQKYKELTSSNSRLERAANSNSDDPDYLMNIIEKELTSIKYKAFGKVKIKKRDSVTPDELENLIGEKDRLLSHDDVPDKEKIDSLETRISLELRKRQQIELKKRNHKSQTVKRN